MNYRIHVGDCREVLGDYSDATFDSVVSDPPYGLTFMGKGWDRGVPGEEFWREALRVAKPGAHLLAFGGTRTFHRLAVAIEDAGWEIRDCVMWVYGSGFPKSLDVGKAIDKIDATEEQTARRLRFTAWVRSTGLTAKQIDDATRTNMGGHYTTAASQPAIMTREHLDAVRHLIAPVPEWVERECEIRSVESRNFAAREVTGKHEKASAATTWRANNGFDADLTPKERRDIPATDEARQWDGWGTALKPAWEPVIVARKPLDGTVASNVLRHGTGALNIDGCRVGTDGGTTRTGKSTHLSPSGAFTTGHSIADLNAGRWPANLLHDGSDEVLAGFPDDEGRYFYCAKASRTDREEGCDHLPARSGADAVERDEGTAGLQSPRAGAGRTADTVRNFHPTVKPTDLMRYLCRLVTQPNGLVLDPFCGSGSTGKGALLEGFRFVGIDLDPAHVAIAEARCQFAVDTVEAIEAAATAPGSQLSLF